MIRPQRAKRWSAISMCSTKRCRLPVPGSSPAACNRRPTRNHCVSSPAERWSSPMGQNTETQMRKLKIIEHISLDGVIQHSADDGDFPYSDWTAPYRTPAGRDLVMAAHGERVGVLLR